jgi:hypothetical protein
VLADCQDQRDRRREHSQHLIVRHIHTARRRPTSVGRARVKLACPDASSRVCCTALRDFHLTC